MLENVRSFQLTTLLVAALCVFSGCGDESTTEPDGSGTIIIALSPDSIHASWTLIGPSGYSASANGDTSLSGLAVGEYTATWDGVGGWTSPPRDTRTLTKDVTITFSGTYGQLVQIPSGIFTMGSPPDEPGRWIVENLHTVTLTTPFLMMSTEVTNQQYTELAQWAYDQGRCTATSASVRDALDGSTEILLDLDDPICEISFAGGRFTVDAGREHHPVIGVHWYGAVAYCDWLSLQAGLSRAYSHDNWQCGGGDPYSAQGYRLPTEAEWEFACRAGSVTAFANGEITNTDCSDLLLNEIGWYCGFIGVGTHPVAEKISNSWGLYDMHGNLWEWCNDWFAGFEGDETDPVGPASGDHRVIRGGSWQFNAQLCRSATRGYYGPGDNHEVVGLRPVRSTN